MLYSPRGLVVGGGGVICSGGSCWSGGRRSESLELNHVVEAQAERSLQFVDLGLVVCVELDLGGVVRLLVLRFHVGGLPPPVRDHVVHHLV